MWWKGQVSIIRRLGNLFSSWIMGSKALWAGWTSTPFCAIKPCLSLGVQTFWASGSTCLQCLMTRKSIWASVFGYRGGRLTSHLCFQTMCSGLGRVETSLHLEAFQDRYKQSFWPRQSHSSPAGHEQAA